MIFENNQNQRDLLCCTIEHDKDFMIDGQIHCNLYMLNLSYRWLSMESNGQVMERIFYLKPVPKKKRNKEGGQFRQKSGGTN